MQSKGVWGTRRNSSAGAEVRGVRKNRDDGAEVVWDEGRGGMGRVRMARTVTTWIGSMGFEHVATVRRVDTTTVTTMMVMAMTMTMMRVVVR